MNLLNPLSVFLLTWGMVISLYALKWSDVLIATPIENISFFTKYLLLPFFFGYVFSYLLPIKKSTNKVGRKGVVLNCSRVKVLVYFFVIATVFEVIIMKGFPLLWAFIGDTRGYVDYGIPSFHGLLNAIQLSLTLIFFYKALEKKTSWWPFIFFNLWNVCMFSRFLIMIMLIQVVVLFIQLRGASFKRTIKVGVVFFVVLFLFGILGDIRSDISYDIYKSFFGLNENYPDFLSWSYIWPYLYLTTPYNNLVAWESFNNFNYSFSSVYSGLLPSFIRNEVFSAPLNEPKLVHETFNMSTGYAPALMDMGTIGLSIYNFMIGIWITIQWRLSRTLTNYFSYSVSVTCLFYMLFFNTLFTLPIIFQYLILRLVVSYRHINTRIGS